MNLYSIPPFVVGVTCLLVGVLVGFKGRPRPANFIYSTLTFSIATWFIGYSIAYSCHDPSHALFWVKISYVGIIYIPITFYHFVVSFLGLQRERRWALWGYAAGIAFVLLDLLTDRFVSGLYHYPWGYHTKVGFLHNFYLPLFFGLNLRGFWLLYIALKGQFSERSPEQRNRLRYLLCACVIAFFGAVDFLPHYGIPIYPFGYVFLAIAAITTTFAIVRYRLMEVKLAVTRGTIFVLLYTLAIGAPFFIAVSGKVWLQSFAGENWWTVPFGLLAVLSLLVPIFYRILQAHAEARIFKTERQYQAALRTMSQELVGFADAKSLCSFVGRYIGEQMGLDSADLFVHGNGLGVPHTIGNDISRGVKEVLERWITAPSRTEAYILAEELGAGKSDAEIRAVRTWMARVGIYALVLGWLRGELVTCLVLGRKRTGEIFSAEDLEVLEALARQSSLVVKNIELADEVHEQKRLAQYGKLMAAINHEFNNLFAILSGTLQLIAEKLGDPQLRETVHSLQEEIELGQFLIRAAAAYRKKHPTPLQAWAVAKLLDEALAQAQQDAFAGAKPRWTMQTAVPQDVEVVGRATIPELVANCLRCLGWTCDSKPGTLQIEVTKDEPGVQLKFVACGGEDLRAEIEKQGEWAQPGRHGGLYYFLVEMIVADHRGGLRLESTPGGGTTLIVHLPQEPAAVTPPPPQAPMEQLS